MLLSGLLLATLALALAWPVPLLLHKRRHTAEDPLVALLLWQAIGLAGGLSLIGALVYLALSSLGWTFPEVWHGVQTFLGPEKIEMSLGHIVLLVGGLLLAVHMFITLLVGAWRTQRHRRRHFEVLQLVSAPGPAGSGVRVLQSQEPVAYCLPAGAEPVTVVSSGLLTLLNEDQRAAVIAHEASHVRQRHDLFMLPFLAWRKSLPGFYAPSAAMHSVGELLELVADDDARAVVPARDLAAAVALMNDATLVDRPESIERRLSRLAKPPSTGGRSTRVAAVASALLLLALPPAIGLLPLLG